MSSIVQPSLAFSNLTYPTQECDFQRAGTLEDLSRCVSRLVTFSLLSFTAWVNSIVWLSLDNTTNFRMYHGCNYGFILGGVVALMAGSLAQVSTRRGNEAVDVRSG